MAKRFQGMHQATHGSLTLQPPDVHGMIFANLDVALVSSLASSCKLLHTALKLQLINLLNCRNSKQNRHQPSYRAHYEPSGKDEQVFASIQQLQLDAERVQIAAVALVLSEPREVRRVVMECDALCPSDTEDCATTWSKRVELRLAWKGTEYDARRILNNIKYKPIVYSGLLWRLTRTWSLAEQAVTFSTCRPCGDTAEGVVQALASPNDDDSVLALGWGEPATALMSRCESLQEKVTLFKLILSELNLSACTTVTLGRLLHVMAGGPNLHQLLEEYIFDMDAGVYLRVGDRDLDTWYCWSWDRDLDQCPCVINDEECEHVQDKCSYCSYSSASLAAVVQLLAADWTIEEQVRLLQAVIGCWSDRERLIFMSHFCCTASMTSVQTLDLASHAWQHLGFGDLQASRIALQGDNAIPKRRVEETFILFGLEHFGLGEAGLEKRGLILKLFLPQQQLQAQHERQAQHQLHAQQQRFQAQQRQLQAQQQQRFQAQQPLQEQQQRFQAQQQRFQAQQQRFQAQQQLQEQQRLQAQQQQLQTQQQHLQAKKQLQVQQQRRFLSITDQATIDMANSMTAAWFASTKEERNRFVTLKAENTRKHAAELAEFKRTNLFYKLATTFLGIFQFLLERSHEHGELCAPDHVRRSCFQFLKRALTDSDFELFFGCIIEDPEYQSLLTTDGECECRAEFGDSRECDCIDNETRRTHDLLTMLISDEKCKAHFTIKKTSIKLVTASDVCCHLSTRTPLRIHVHYEQVENKQINTSPCHDQPVGWSVEWEPLLAEMADFGFTKSATARAALIKSHGDIKAAMKMLVQMLLHQVREAQN